MDGWNLQPELATKRQRCALYRLGYGRWIVHQMSKEEASKAIADGLERMSRIRSEGQNEDTPESSESGVLHT